MIDISEILKKEPTLTPFGIEGENTFKAANPIFHANEIKQIETCIEWLNTRHIQKTINKISTSYGIKHVLERELKTYVCNGSFIAAVIHLNIPYIRIMDSPNIHVPISRRETYKNDPANQRLLKGKRK